MIKLASSRLNETQINELYELMKKILTERNDTEKLEQLNKEDFRGFIVATRFQYLKDREKGDFYTYAEDQIYHTACFE